ncbi:MAG: DUF1761 domain-containing protein [Pseudomonadota bacterium]
MGIIAIIVAAAAAWIFGAVWYGIIGKQWMEAAGLTEDSIDRKNPVPYVGSFLCAIVVAAMTQYIFTATGTETVAGGFITGLGLGALIAAPWIATNVLFQQKSKSLIWMDGAYPTLGMAVMGLVLTLF